MRKVDGLLDKGEFVEVVFTRFVNAVYGFWVKKLNYKECISEKSRRLVVDTQGFIG